MATHLTPRQLTERLMDFLNTGDESIADEIISERKQHLDYYNEVDKNTVPGAKQADGIAGVKEQVRVMRNAFPDGHWQVEEYIELPEEGRIATRDRWTGTHKGSFMGVEATGRKIDVTAMAFSRVKDSKIIQSEMMFDKLALLQQLGARIISEE
ncbi:SnoaL-domain-containing protein [Rhizodiscina lignyota]|uniref:SnoaL-domain-containing protein n=1 Tax=Rhizodiscina lignyota TaxID=1504668 RepID=A0A9P4ICC0_9PEZI|nr:SnoaL-domain-containing protein [Rhizodiscina lignyota]